MGGHGLCNSDLPLGIETEQLPAVGPNRLKKRARVLVTVGQLVMDSVRDAERAVRYSLVC